MALEPYGNGKAGIPVEKQRDSAPPMKKIQPNI
jgi:hypothetical protein